MESTVQTTEIAYLIGIGVLIMVLLVLVMLAYSNRAQRKLLQQKMETQGLELRYQQELIQHNLLTQEEERQRIAAHLHDDIGSKLGVLSLTFHRLRRTGAHQPDYESLCEEITSLIGTTLQTARTVSHDLLPPTLENFGLIVALEEFIEGVRKTGTVDFRFDCEVERSELGDAIAELNLFRIVQELTSNSLKHANANFIGLHLHKTQDGVLLLEYADDGRGFDVGTANARGLGTRNLENRARILNGTIEVKTAVGEGFQFRLTWPRTAVTH
jgi:signal transduction histidine kinase